MSDQDREPDGIALWIAKGRIYTRTPFALKDTMKTVGGYRWDPDVRGWHYPATSAAAAELMHRLLGHKVTTDPGVDALLEDAAAERDAMAHKEAGDDELAEIPGRMPAWLHQKRAYHFAKARRGTMLAMDMGTGKSRTAISLLDGWGIEAVVIVCPAKVVNVWPNQFALHSERDWRVIVAPASVPVVRRTAHIAKQVALAAAQHQPVAIVVNFEAAWRKPLGELLKATRGFTLIIDESHRIKAPGGKASTFCATLAERADRVLQLTGTPMPHSPLDVYAQFRALDPGIYGTSFVRFRAKYAVMGGYEDRQVIGYQNMEDLTERFARASLVVRKSEAGLDLPPVVHVDRKFALEPRTRKAYATIDQDFILGVGDGTVTTSNALVKLLRLQQVTSGYVKDDDDVEHQIGDEKISLLEDVLEDLDPAEPVVIFARFKHDLALIRGLCEKLERRYGEVSGACKPGKPDYGLNEHSQMRDDLDVVALQIQSGGVGIDLTRSAYAIYYSLDFSLGNFEQSLARLDRPGQTRPVTYIHLIAEATKDEVVYTALQERKDVVEAVIEASRDVKVDRRGGNREPKKEDDAA